ncbi:MAG: carbamoyltransferase family protein [Pseudobdellovibrio sp.]
MKILGIAAFYHDSSASLIEGGQIIAACQEERLTRIKHDSNFPTKSILYCLEQANIKPEEVDEIVFYEKPFLKFERLLETYLAFVPKGFTSFAKAMPLWLDEKLFQKKLLKNELMEIGFTAEQCAKILFSSHHLSHAASAFFPSPFEEALVLTMDGVGEWDTTTVYHGKGNTLKKISELRFPHSLGLLYSAFTYYCGFKVNSGEYKLMGLAPYGKPVYVQKIKSHLVDVKMDGSFKIDLSYFDYCTGLTMTNEKFNTLFENNLRKPEDKIEQVHMDLAASIQAVLEEIVIKICLHIKTSLQVSNLCLAGGVALNCVANGKLHKLEAFKDIWIQPAAGDAGGSLGAALAAQYLHLKTERTVNPEDSMQGAYLGPAYQNSQIEDFLKLRDARYKAMSDEELLSFMSEALASENVIGWFKGRMEFGPRALGNRSILADARSENMQKTLNLKTKFRESFRPFAPIVLEEKVSEWFDFNKTSPYMLMVAPVHTDKLSHRYTTNRSGFELLNEVRSVIPAVTHIDNSARIQTVNSKTNTQLYNLLKEFEKKTKTPVLINTSFNIRGEPIVCTPQDAYRCFMGTNIDILVLENFVLMKDEQPEKNKEDYKDLFELD